MFTLLHKGSFLGLIPLHLLVPVQVWGSKETISSETSVAIPSECFKVVDTVAAAGGQSSKQTTIK